MKTPNNRPDLPTISRHAMGFSLVEVMVAMALALLLLMTVASVFLSERNTYAAQTGLAQLQEKERTTITLLNGIAQSAGYYTSPTTNTVATVFPVVTGTYTTAGQFVTGTGNGTNQDTFNIRYQTSGNDGVMDCQGNTYTVAQVIDNQFSIATANGLSVLQCAVNGGTAQPLVDGISGMNVLYGVDPNKTGSVTQYVMAGSVPDWTQVLSLRITLTFNNPLSNASGSNGQQPITFIHTISLMGAA